MHGTWKSIVARSPSFFLLSQSIHSHFPYVHIYTIGRLLLLTTEPSPLHSQQPKMHTAKAKISNMASAAREHMTICRAKVEEKVEKATARTHEEKEIAKERRKAKEAQAKMELHQAKAKHAAEKSTAKRTHHHVPGVGAGHHLHQPPPTVGGYPNQPVGATVPAYPVGGHPPVYN